MRMASLLPATAAMLPYPTVPIGTLLGRAWNLFRSDMRRSLLIMLLPSVLDACAGIAIALPAATPGDARAGAAYSGLLVLSYGVGLLLLAVNFFVRAGALVTLSGLYRATIERRCLSLRQAFQAVRAKGMGLASACFGLFLLAIVLIICDWVVLTLGMLLLAVLATGTLAYLFATLGPWALVAVMGGLVAGVGLGAAILALAGFQCLCCLLPLAAIASETQTTVNAQWRALFRSYRLIGCQPLRAGAFGLMLLMAYSALSLALSLPSQIASFMALSTSHMTVMPVSVSIGLNLYGMVVSALVWPFIFAALTLFWYDCQVRSEGADLGLRVQRLRQGLVSENEIGQSA